MVGGKVKVFGARLLSTLLLWAVVTAVFLSGNPWGFVGLIGFLGFAGSWEFARMTTKSGFPTQRGFGLLVSWLYLLVVAILLAVQGKQALSVIASLDAAAVCLVVLSSFTWELWRKKEGRDPLIRVACTVFSFIYIPFLFSFMLRLLFVPDCVAAVPGAWLILWVVVVTKFTDMGAYITGTVMSNFMTTHKMIPHVSPGKTWEGFCGALVFALIAACGLYALLPEQLSVLECWGHVIMLAVVMALLAVVGDLAESIVKRSLQIKDSGSVLPGIGGALDLIDSLCFTAPVVYFYVILVISA